MLNKISRLVLYYKNNTAECVKYIRNKGVVSIPIQENSTKYLCRYSNIRKKTLT